MELMLSKLFTTNICVFGWIADINLEHMHFSFFQENRMAGCSFNNIAGLLFVGYLYICSPFNYETLDTVYQSDIYFSTENSCHHCKP